MRGLCRYCAVVLFLLICLCQRIPDEIALQTHRVRGYGHFQPQWVSLCPNMVPANDPFKEVREQPQGIPHEFGNLSVIWIDMQIGQHIYHAMKSGAIEKDKATSIIKQWNIDTSTVTHEYVDQEISCAIGTSSEGDVVCIPDTDNDENLGDEKPIIIKRKTIDSLKALHPDVMVMTDNIPYREVFFEYYDGESIKITRQFIAVNPSFMYGKDRIPVCSDQFIVNLSTYEFRTASLEIGSDEYTFVCANGFKPGLYSPINTRIMIDTKGLQEFTTSKEGNQIYGIRDTVNLGKQTFLIEDISVDGSVISLKKFIHD
ncbi:MAG: hypothetical protein GF401_04390 [Chitinivibrionales bacterium]|nr:hypothetical protein [Chitinivibrionales bacterium]